MKRSTIITIAVVIAIAGLFFYMTTATASQECTVCMEFRGLRNCASAVAPTTEQAQEGAQTTACGPIASGMDQSIACGRTPPASVQCRTR
jgi:hypothetical protein